MRPATGDRARLDAGALARLSDRVTLPGHLRSATPTIVHLGLGAFARAHLAVYADDLLAAGRPGMVRGVSLRSPRAEQQLAPQDGLYSVLEREPGRPAELRVVGSIHSVSTGQRAAIDAVAAPTTRLVTVTVTEKAYAAPPDDPTSVARVVADGIAARGTGAPTVVIASLDNVADNGLVLREAVLAAAALVDASLADRISDEVSFPCSVVDRMVPATTEADLVEVEDRLGFVDLGAVVAEQHRSWVITHAAGLPPLEDVGVVVVDDIEPYQRRKLWLLNGPHSALAYAGLLMGCGTIAEAATNERAAPFVRALVDDVLGVADLPQATEPEGFARETLRRFENAALGHTCLQVGADGSKKIPQRILPVVALAEQAGRPTHRFATVVAAWAAAVAVTDVAGGRLPVPDDPLAGELQHVARRADLAALVDRALAGAASRRFHRQVVEQLHQLHSHGALVLAGGS